MEIHFASGSCAVKIWPIWFCFVQYTYSFISGRSTLTKDSLKQTRKKRNYYVKWVFIYIKGSRIFILGAQLIMCVQSLQMCWTLWDPMDCSLSGSSVMGFSKAKILEWVATPGDLPNPETEPAVSPVASA